MNETNRQDLKAMVNGAYDLSSLRIAIGNRLCATYRAKLGLAPCDPEKLGSKEATDILTTLRKEFQKITDGVKKKLPSLKNFVGKGIISSYTELCLVETYINIEEAEANAFAHLKDMVKEFEIYNSFLEPIRGMGPAYGGVIISSIDIFKARTPSALWQYCGDPTKAKEGFDEKDRQNRRSVTRRKCDLVDRPYRNKAGELSVRKGLAYNPWVRTKLYLMSVGFMRQGRRQYTEQEKELRKDIRAQMRVCKDKRVMATLEEQLALVRPTGPYGNKYGEIYDNYMSRLQSHPKYGIANEENRKAEAQHDAALYEKNLKLAGEMGLELEDNPNFVSKNYSPALHRMNMALRYMRKMFLIDLYNAWRAIEGLPIEPPYHEEKLGIYHQQTRQGAV